METNVSSFNGQNEPASRDPSQRRADQRRTDRFIDFDSATRTPSPPPRSPGSSIDRMDWSPARTPDHELEWLDDGSQTPASRNRPYSGQPLRYRRRHQALLERQPHVVNDQSSERSKHSTTGGGITFPRERQQLMDLREPMIQSRPPYEGESRDSMECLHRENGNDYFRNKEGQRQRDREVAQTTERDNQMRVRTFQNREAGWSQPRMRSPGLGPMPHSQEWDDIFHRPQYDDPHSGVCVSFKGAILRTSRKVRKSVESVFLACPFSPTDSCIS